MEERHRPKERAIMPRDLLDHYIMARMNTYSWMDPSEADPDLSIPGSKGFIFPPQRLEPADKSPYMYIDEWVNGKEKGSFAGKEINLARYNVLDVITVYFYMGGLTEEGMKLGEGFVYTLLLRGFLRGYPTQTRLGENVQFEAKFPQGKAIYKGAGIKLGRFWHDVETIELDGERLYIGRGDGAYNPEARKKAIAEHTEGSLI